MKINMRAATVIVLGLAVGAVAFKISKIVHASPATGPFTVTTTEKAFDASGNQQRLETIVFATGVNGSRVVATTRKFPDGQDRVIRRILEVNAKKLIVVDEATKSIVTYPLPPEGVEFLSRGCSIPAGAETAVLSGAAIFKYSETKEYGEDVKAVGEEWRAPSLGCLALRQTHSMFRNDKLAGKSTRELVSIVNGEPDPSLFAIPTDYVERSPSEALSVYHQLFPTRPATPAATLEKLDKAYHSNDALR
jgi:hypothetical protein